MNATCLRDCFRWPWSLDAAWVALPIFVVTVRTLLQPITPEDYWWSLAMGELIDRGHWPRSNLFLYTIPSDQPFFNQAWLAQWIMTRIGRLAHAGNLILNTLLAVVAWGLIIRMALRRGARPPVIGVMATVGYFMGAGSMVVRSQMFAYVLFVCCALLLLELARDQVRWRVWAALIALTALWANLHGTFIYAPLLLLAAASGTTIAASPS